MNAVSLAADVLAVVASLAALTISSWIALRQTKYVRDANHVQVAIEFLKEFRTPAFIDSLEYVVRQLSQDHDPKLGITKLPAVAREHVLNVGYYYQAIAVLVA